MIRKNIERRERREEEEAPDTTPISIGVLKRGLESPHFLSLSLSFLWSALSDQTPVRR